jgi:arylsulfatase A-like enzyme
MKKKPNILLITTDQQRYDTINALGYDFMHTPNLVRLAKVGCVFTNPYSPNPVCIPARHNLLTGLTARHHGFDDNYFVDKKNIPYNLPTFPQILSDGGYDTVAIGKLHFQPYRRHNGFHRLYLMDEIPEYREDDDYAMYLKEQGYDHLQSIHGVRHLLYMLPQRSLLPEKHHGNCWVADKTIAYLEENRGRRPFLIWAGFIHPHPPFDVPDDWADLYKDTVLPEPFISRTPLSPLAEENKPIADYPNPKYLHRARELYYASISHVDHNIGKILAKLEEIGELDNTMILFTSDHGEMMGDHGTYQKFLPYDSSSKVPFIVRYPSRMPAGSVHRDFVDLNDILPTFLDAADIDYPGNLELPGESIFVEVGHKNRQVQYIEYCKDNKRWVSLRNKRYKFNYYYGGGHEELFDMINDPMETTNLLHELKPNHPNHQQYLEARLELREHLIGMEEKFGLEGYVEDGDFKKMPPYEPNYYRETNFPKFPKEIVRNGEREALISILDEILLAIQKEPIVQLDELDLNTFQKYGGFTDEEIHSLIERSKKNPN